MKLWFTGNATGWMRQFRTIYPLRSGLPMESTIDVENPENVTKTVRLIVRDSDLTQNLQCVFTIPPNAPMRTYTLRFVTNTDWEIIRFDVRPDVNADPEGLLFDNMNLQYRPSLSISGKECIHPTVPPLPPEDTNLVYNPSFNLGANGDAGWRDIGSIQMNVTNAVMNLSFPSAIDGWMRQFIAQYPLRAGLVMEASVDIKNPENVAKNFRLMALDSDLSNVL